MMVSLSQGIRLYWWKVGAGIGVGRRHFCHYCRSLIRRSLAGVLTVAVDWHDPTSLDAACRAQMLWCHLAAMNEADCEKEPGLALRINGLATLMLLQAAQSGA